MKERLSKFNPALGLANAHLMTLAPLAMRRTFPLTDCQCDKLIIDVDGTADGPTLDDRNPVSEVVKPDRNQVVVALHRPEKLLELNKNYAPLTKGLSQKLVVIVHGLEGSVESSYVKGVCEKALSIGFSVCRINLRNCGDTLHLARGLYNAGMSEDVVAVASELKKLYGFDQIFFSGFSLGGNIVLKAAGEQGKFSKSESDCLIDAVCAVCPPVELDQCVTTIERGENWLYEHGFLISLKEKVRAKNRLFPGRFDIEILPSINSLRGFDNTFTAPDAGYADAASYYHGASALRVVSEIKVPTLVVAAVDDPLVPISSFVGSEFAANEHVKLLTPKNGGHVGFISANDLYLHDLAKELSSAQLLERSICTKTNRTQLRDRFWSEWQVVQFFLSQALSS